MSDTPTLPKGYFFRVSPTIGSILSGYVRVQLRKKVWIGSVRVGDSQLANIREHDHQTKAEIRKEMLELRERHLGPTPAEKVEHLLGDYPPKEL